MIDFQKVNLSTGLKFTLNSMSRGKKYLGQISNTCNVPYTQVSIDSNSNCFLCVCAGWLPIPVGTVTDFDSLESIWNSDVAKMLQKDIAQKKYTWCAVEHCGVAFKNIINKRHSLAIGIDDSCNLSCPSCRRDVYMLDSGPEFQKKKTDLEHVLGWLIKFDKPIDIWLGVTGDALASHITRSFIKNYHPRPEQKFIITTNGLLIKKIIKNSTIHSAISEYNISVDAASPQTYEQVRRPGKWKNLIENLDWLSENKLSSTVNLMFVVQKTNYKEIPAFVDLANHYGFNALFTPLNDWGTWNSNSTPTPDIYTIKNGTYSDHDVADPDHPEHQEFIQVLRNMVDKDSKFLDTSTYFQKFL
jgi:sulfatase maturation enzyme AslB (radical SAM superfamily)